MESHRSGGVSRRTALKAIGLVAAGGAIAAGSAALASPAPSPTFATPPDSVPLGRSTPAEKAISVGVSQWAAQRGSRYYIAHRGSGDVLPEHSMEAYEAAVQWGAQCLEISVGMTSDGVLICMHDLTYDRTTNLEGRLRDQPASVLKNGRVWQPQLGRYWTSHAPRIPLFEDVLRTMGGRVVLAVEAKDDQAFEPMMAMVEKYGLRASVIVKALHIRRQWLLAKQAGYPVFVYFGSSAEEITVDALTKLGRQLNRSTDYLAIPRSRDTGPYLPDRLVAAAVATEVPVWVYPLHRRCDAQHFFDRGVQGAICSSYGYIAGSTTTEWRDSWASQKITAGQLSKDPATATYAPDLTPAGELVLALQGSQHFITLGQATPMSGAASSYSLSVEAGWKDLPDEMTGNLSIGFGRADDSYYEHRQGQGDGYHAILRASGELGLYRHHDGRVDGQKLATAITPPLRPGAYAKLRINVTPSAVAVSRVDTGTTISAPDNSVRGGYIHLGRTSVDGVAAFRHFAIG